MIPALIGAGLAIAGGVNNAIENKERRDETEKAYNQIQNLTQQTNAANKNDIDTYQAFLNKMYGGSDAAYKAALEDYNNLATPTVKTDYSYIGDVNEFLDPAAQMRADAAMDAIRGDSGDIFSSDYYNRMAAKQQALASDEYAKAWDRMNADRSQDLTEFNTNNANTWNNFNAAQQKIKDILGAYGGDRTNLAAGTGDALVAGMNNRTANLQSQANTITGLNNSLNQQQSGFGSFMQPLMSFMGSYFGGN
jgi:hypothetical protein